ncbi:membrane protein [Streptococcus porcinus]|nr:membrane protein [Streptococcus porcinus]
MSNQSRKNKRKRHKVYEGIRCASALTFISGYVNTFTFLTQGRRFAGVQTGNVMYLAIRIVEKDYLCTAPQKLDKKSNIWGVFV